LNSFVKKYVYHIMFESAVSHWDLTC